MSEDTIDTGELLKAYRPIHDQLNDVTLSAYVTVLGLMQVGKTTTVNTLINGINRQYPDYKQLNIYTKNLGAVFQMHQHKDIVKRVKNSDILNIYVDDTITSMHSKKQNVESEKQWYTVRHYFKERLGIKKITINFFFAAQRYMTLSNALRQSPILIVKATSIRDWNEERFYEYLLGHKNLLRLKQWIRGVYIEKNLDYLSYSFVKIGDEDPVFWEIPKTGDVDYLHLPDVVVEPKNIWRHRLGELCYKLREGLIPIECFKNVNGSYGVNMRNLAKSMESTDYPGLSNLVKAYLYEKEMAVA